MVKMHKTRIRLLLAIGPLAAILASQISTAQTTPPPEGTVNSSGSVLHGRTIGVARAILNQLPGITQFNHVTDLTQLSGITSLSIGGQRGVTLSRPNEQSLTSLQAGDFDGLVNLQSLDLARNWLASLPSGIFDGLTNLQSLGLHGNSLSSLPSGIFDDLANLQRLDLGSNPLATLPSGIFDDLANLQYLSLYGNPFSSNLPAGIFDGLTNLQTLYFTPSYRIRTSLPAGIFDRLTNLRDLHINDIILFFSQPSGTFANHRNLRVWDALRRSAVERENLLWSWTSSSLSVVDSPGSVLHGRSRKVAGAILEKLPDITQFNQVTNLTQLSGITSLSPSQRFDPFRLTSLQANDFKGLVNLQTLWIYGNTQLTNLPAGVFDELVNLQLLNLGSHPLTTLPAEVFDKLVNLQTLGLSSTQLTTLPAGIFDKLVNLQTLNLTENRLTTLPARVFDELANLQTLNLDSNRLTTLPAGVFDELANLQTLNLYNNRLTTLPAGIFDELVNLQTLNLYNNRLTTLPAGIFDELVNLQTLNLAENRLITLPAEVFDELVNLQKLDLHNRYSLNDPHYNGLTSLPSGIFDELVNLRTISLRGNNLLSLPSGLLGNHPNLADIDIQGLSISSSSPLLSAVNSPSSVFHGRTRWVANVILNAIPDVTHFNQVTNLAQLANLTREGNLLIGGVTRLRAGDLAGLTDLRGLSINAPLTSLPSGIFDDLTNMKFLRIGQTKLTTLPSGIFDKLVNLIYLDIYNNRLLTSLPAGIFKKNVRLRDLYLENNALTALPSGIFDNLYFHNLNIIDNALTTLPAGIFDRVRIALELNLRGNPFTSLPAGIFDRFDGGGDVRGVVSSLLPITISLTPSSLEILEGNEENANAVFQIEVLNRYNSGSFSVDYATQDGTATAGEDYTAASGTLSLTTSRSSSTIQTISIPILDDDVTNELPKTFTLTLSNPTNAVFLDGVSELTATVTITDNEDPPIVSFSNVPLNAHILEIPEGDAGATNAEFQVELGQVSAQDTSILYTTVDGTAIAGQDYTETSGTLIFPAGTTNLTQTISIPILGDTLEEPNESFNVILLNPTNSVLQPKTVRIEIIDDDEPAPPVNVNIDGAVTPIITPFPSRDGGLSAKSLMFKNKQVSLNEGQSATYQVRATSSQEREMVVNLATSHSGITLDPSRLVFNQNTWQSYQTVTVTASSDAADTNERATIRHSIPESLGFVAINDAGIVSVAIAHTIVEEEETPEPEPREQAPIVQLPPTDYDLDDDGLIEVRNLAQLHALRFDLNGDGQPDKEEVAAAYKQAFPSAIANMGVPADILAQGYELTTNLNFDTNQDKTINEEDAFWNKGKGWPSIGSFAEPFQAVFEGNGHTIDNLFQDQSDPALFADEPSGLFGVVGNRGQVINLGLEGVNIQGVNWVGALAGLNLGSIGVCSVTGRVEGVNGVGGLVGRNFGDIVLSVADVEVKGVLWVDDLVGIDSQAR